MHSGTVFWGTKEELRRIMAIMEQTDAQVQMFEREQGDWTLHVNFAGAEMSRLVLENNRLRARIQHLEASITAEDIVTALRAWDEFAGDRISDHEDENSYALFVATWLNQRAEYGVKR